MNGIVTVETLKRSVAGDERSVAGAMGGGGCVGTLHGKSSIRALPLEVGLRGRQEFMLPVQENPSGGSQFGFWSL